MTAVVALLLIDLWLVQSTGRGTAVPNAIYINSVPEVASPTTPTRLACATNPSTDLSYSWMLSTQSHAVHMQSTPSHSARLSTLSLAALLPQETTEADLREVFEKFGDIKMINSRHIATGVSSLRPA